MPLLFGAFELFLIISNCRMNMYAKYQMMLDQALQSGKRLVQPEQEKDEESEEGQRSVEKDEPKPSATKTEGKHAHKDSTAKAKDRISSKDILVPVQSTPSKELPKGAKKEVPVKIVFGKRVHEASGMPTKDNKIQPKPAPAQSHAGRSKEDIVLKSGKRVEPASGQKSVTPSSKSSRVGTPSRNKKQMLSVQEEFYKHNQRCSTPQSAKSNKSVAPQETLDIYKKYDFLKNGKIRISQKASKYLCSRIKPADCVIHVLDALFLLLGRDLTAGDTRQRFADYKVELSNLSEVNSRLKALFFALQAEPEHHAREIQLASASLEKFYSNSIFGDLVTVDHCKEIAWIVQGLCRYQQKGENGTLNNTQTDESEGLIADRIEAHRQRVAKAKVDVQSQSYTESSLSNTQEMGAPQIRIANFSYTEDDELPLSNPYLSEEVDLTRPSRNQAEHDSRADDRNLLTLAPPQFVEEKDFVSFGRNESGYNSINSQSDPHPDFIFNRESKDLAKDKHKEKVQEMLRQMYTQQDTDSQHLGYEEDYQETLERPIQIENWGRDSSKVDYDPHHANGGGLNGGFKPSRYFNEEDEEPREFDRVMKASLPKKSEVREDHPILDKMEVARHTFNVKSYIILKNQATADISAIYFLQAMLLLSGDLKEGQLSTYSAWKDLKGLLGSAKVDSFITGVFKPHTIMAISREAVKRAGELMQRARDHIGREDQNLQSFYTNKLASFLNIVLEVYYFAKDNPQEYLELYGLSSEKNGNN